MQKKYIIRLSKAERNTLWEVVCDRSNVEHKRFRDRF